MCDVDMGTDNSDTELALATLQSLFVHQDALARHLRAPMLEKRGAYLARLIEAGRKRRAITESASTVCHVIRLPNSTMAAAVDEADIGEAAKKYVSETQSTNLPYHRSSIRRFKTVARSWCQFLGLFIPQARPFCQYENEYIQFKAALVSEFNYLPSSVQSCISYVRQFLV